VKVLGSMTTDKLERVARILGIRTVKPLDVIVKQDAPGDSMFLILEGEVRVRQMIKGVEKTLTVIPAGEFFGELSLFDHSPRSADVVAVKTCKLIEVGGESLRALERSAPDVAAEFLFAVGKTMARRIRMDNHRWGKLIEHLQSIGVDVSQMLR
jgi:CRP-like cAMP-binding protein